MREIKFRAKDWGGNLRYSSEFGFLHQFFLEFHLQKWACLEQFTGLTDKNGVEIYRGDKILCKNGRVHIIMFGEFFVEDKYRIESCIGFYFYDIKTRETEAFGKPDEGYEYEVIGNIHEQEDK